MKKKDHKRAQRGQCADRQRGDEWNGALKRIERGDDQQQPDTDDHSHFPWGKIGFGARPDHGSTRRDWNIQHKAQAKYGAWPDTLPVHALTVDQEPSEENAVGDRQSNTYRATPRPAEGET